MMLTCAQIIEKIREWGGYFMAPEGQGLPANSVIHLLPDNTLVMTYDKDDGVGTGCVHYGRNTYSIGIANAVERQEWLNNHG